MMRYILVIAIVVACGATATARLLEPTYGWDVRVANPIPLHLKEAPCGVEP